MYGYAKISMGVRQPCFCDTHAVYVIAPGIENLSNLFDFVIQALHIPLTDHWPVRMLHWRRVLAIHWTLGLGLAGCPQYAIASDQSGGM